MPFFNENQLEQSIIALLQEQGYDYVKGEEIVRDLDEVVLRDDLSAYLNNRYKNDGITDQEVENAIRIITQKQGGTLYAENKHTLNLLMDGFSLKREDPAKQNLYIYPIAFDEANQKHNIFKVVNQFDITEIEHRIPDIIIFVNGLPVVVFELKSATKQDTTIEDAYKQLTIRYRRDIPSLFKYTAFIVVSDGVNSKFGTLYTKGELTAISGVCRCFGLKLYLDGARLACGLMCPSAELTLPDLAEQCDVFYIGGTKCGALCGEAVVFPRHGRPTHFTNAVKKRGALLAKGRLLGVQFDALFTDGLYFRIGQHEADMAEKLKSLFKGRGIPLWLDSPTNQQFVELEDRQIEKLGEKVAFSFWEKRDERHTVIRFVTGWSTTEEDLAALASALDELK